MKKVLIKTHLVGVDVEFLPNKEYELPEKDADSIVSAGCGVYVDTGLAPKVTSEMAPEVVPDVVPEVTPEVTLEVTPEVTPEVVPEVAPEVSPEVDLGEKAKLRKSRAK